METTFRDQYREHTAGPPASPYPTQTQTVKACVAPGTDLCEVDMSKKKDGEAGGRILTLAEWDAANTEQRTEWLKDGWLLTLADAETLRNRAYADGFNDGHDTEEYCPGCKQEVPLRHVEEHDCPGDDRKA